MNIQKDNKVVSEAGNSTPMEKMVEVMRYDRKERKKVPISVWSGHAQINLIYGMLDQATSWRTKAGGHKWKAARYSKSLTHFAMFGVLPTNAFLNMKMANPQDKRTFREFKSSLCRYSMIHAPSLGLRDRRRQSKAGGVTIKCNRWRHTLNP